MNLLYLTQGLLGLGIFIFIFFKLILRKDANSMKVVKNFIALGFLHLIISILSLFWYFGALEYSVKDYFILYSVLLIVQNLIFFRLTYIFSRNRKLYYFVGMYLFLIPFLIFLFHMYSVLFLILSYLFSLLMFIDFALRDDVYKKVGYIGIFYSSSSLLLFAFLFLNLNNIFIFSLISNLILFFVIQTFILDVKRFSVLPFKLSKNNSYFFNLMSHLIFVVTITNFVFIGTIAIHELGHFLMSQFYGCEYSKIIYDASFFYTESLCAVESVIPYITLAGILLPIFLAIVLLIFGGKFVSEIAILMIGFNLSAISKDLVSLDVSQNFVLISILLGIFFVSYGVFLLAKSKVDLEIYENSAIEESNVNFEKKDAKKSLNFSSKNKENGGG